MPVIRMSRRRRGLVVAGILGSTFMGTLDSSIVNIALQTIARSLRVSAAQTVWVTTVFLLVSAATIPAAATLSDRIGRRAVFLIGVPLFTLASLGCGLSSTLGALVAFRALQGVGASLIFAVAIPMFRMLFGPRELGGVLGLNSMTVAIGISSGPLLGGLLLSIASWHWLFFINVPIGAVIALVGAAVMPRRPADLPAPPRFDGVGAAAIGAALVAVVLGMHQLAAAGEEWTALPLFAGAAVCGGIFIWTERRVASPVIPLDLFNARFTLAVLTAFWSFLGQGIAFVALPLLFQSAYGATPLQAALLFTPWPLAVALVAPFSGRLTGRVPPSRLALIGLTVFTVGLVALFLLPAHPPWWLAVGGTALSGLGFGFFQPANNTDMMAAAPQRSNAAAGAVLNANRTVGQSTGAALVGMGLLIGGAGAGDASAEAAASQAVLLVAAGGAGLSAIVAAIKYRRLRGRQG